MIRGIAEVYKGIYTPKIAKIGAEYVANLVNVNLWLPKCNSAVYYMGML